MSNWCKRAVLAASFCVLSPVALAQPAGLAGTWAFESSLTPDNDCTISGRAVVTSAGQRGVYAVHTTSSEICSSARWDSEQDCTARRNGQRFDIDCTIVRVTPSNYAPDNFTLTIVSDDLMRGSLLSSREGRAIWRRSRALVS